ncbi:hypothetical protein PIB30_023744 [Stylosanthes scabra]|uniref:Uncharacterized protein n=1 Tax=Stylosanthes scabra TaxID=79078 RepID=A0ABU6W9Q9_9FABA|nr:hypothetical protein [Stylosanthes scabra]
MVEEVGFVKYEKLLWHDLSDLDLGTGLHELKGDAEINVMRGAVVMHIGPKEFHIYVEHVVSIPVVVEEAFEGPVIPGNENVSSSDSYESTEDEAYKPPPSGYEEDDSDSEIDRLKEKKKKPLRRKSPKKVVSPRKKKGQNEGGPSIGRRPDLSPKTAFK